MAFAATAIAASFLIDRDVGFGVIALFVVIAPLEKLYPRRRGQRVRRPLVGTDISFVLANPLLNVVGITMAVIIGAASLVWLPALLLRPLVGQLPPLVSAIVAFVLFDFLAYWVHRWAHEVPFLWRFHAVHHSPEHMDWVSAFRIHPFDGVIIGPPVLFLLAAGFGPEVTGVLAVAQILTGLFFHANVRVRWRWLDKAFANPEFHHWHHANEVDAICHNYAPALPQWDLLFGTYFMPDRTSDRRPRHYGVDEYLPRHLLGLLTYPLRGARGKWSLLWHPIRAARAAATGTRNIWRDVRRSTLRPTHSVRRESAPGCRTTNASLFNSTGVRAPSAVPDETQEWRPLVGARSGVIEF